MDDTGRTNAPNGLPGAYHNTHRAEKIDSSSGDFRIEKITIVNPSGGDTYGAGASEDITWTSSGAGSVKIELLKSGSLHEEIFSSTANDGKREL